MKKSFLLLFVILFAFYESNAQEFQPFTAKDGYTALIAGIDGLEAGASLILVQGIYMPETTMAMDLTTGTSTIWVYGFKSKDANDHILYLYMVYNIGGMYGYQSQTETETDAQPIAALSNTWKNSDDLSKEIVKNPTIMNFHNDNAILQELMMLMNNPETNDEVWSVAVMIADESMTVCTYNASTLALIGCQTPTSVNDLVSNSVMLYPNPANTYFNVEIPVTGEVNVSIYNVNGEIVKSEKLNSNGNVMINTTTLPIGVYNAVINTNDGVYSNKIVISR